MASRLWNWSIAVVCINAVTTESWYRTTSSGIICTTVMSIKLGDQVIFYLFAALIFLATFLYWFLWKCWFLLCLLFNVFRINKFSRCLHPPLTTLSQHFLTIRPLLTLILWLNFPSNRHPLLLLLRQIWHNLIPNSILIT